MREVTAAGPHVHEGKSYVSGQKMMLSDTDADWYAKTIVEGRRRDADNPMIAAIATPPAPADATAAAGVETKIASNERTGDVTADSLRDAVLKRDAIPANATQVSQNTATMTQTSVREDGRAEERENLSSTA